VERVVGEDLSGTGVPPRELPLLNSIETHGKGRVPLCLLGLGEEHEDARASEGLDRVLLFFRAARNGQAIARFVLRRFSIHEQHVMMGLVRGNIVQRHVPGIEGAVACEGNFLPAGERADDFHGFGRVGSAVRQAPAENPRVAGSALMRIIL
jgi:hypothetical protein